MRCRRTLPGCRSPGLLRGPALILSVLLVWPVGAAGDVFQLRNGGSVSGSLLTIDEGNYRIRTTVGIVSVPASSVVAVEEAATPFEEYDRRVRATADTADEQTELAAWCDEQGLRAERRRHLRRAVELDPDHAAARRALGYVRVGALWVDGRRVAEAGGEAAADNGDEAVEPEKLARAIQAEWSQRIRAIKHSLLDSSLARLVDEGRVRIREIRDPLAILPLAQVLGLGDRDSRLLLVEMLSRFPEDEATLNLGVLGLVDDDEDIRARAVAALAPRKDPRIVAQYRAALRSGSDVILARAATGLAQLQAPEAVPDLIALLTAQRERWVEVPLRQYMRTWPQTFVTMTTVHLSSGGGLVVHRPEVGVYRDFVLWNEPVRNEWQFREVTVYRTEVLEALKRLTGQNFGFEGEAWRRWYEESPR